MKNKYDDFKILTDFENLYNAHCECRKGKRWKDSVAIYDVRGLECTLALKELLDSGRYKISPYNEFTINERGKKREIKSTKYHDRVVQKSFKENILNPVINPTFLNTNFASQKGKGTDAALKTMKKQMQEYVRKHGTEGYILACDMHDYFGSLPHKYLDYLYELKFEDERILNFIYSIHHSIPGGKGAPLGNELSQNDALMALSPLDHYIKEHMQIKWYGRYMDDFYLIHESKEHLKECLEYINGWIEMVGMELNEKKTKIVTLRHGVDYLGFRFYLTENGKVVQKLLKKSIVHHKRKMKKMKKLLDSGKVTIEDCKKAHNGWKAHAKRGDTYYLLRKMDKRFNELFELEDEKHGEETK